MSVFPVKESDGEEWISVSDLMSGLMLVFLMIAVFFMLQVRDTAVEHDARNKHLCEDLRNEFSGDLKGWKAEIDCTTFSVRFMEPEIFFKSGKSTLREPFKVILADFFPRYIGVLTGDGYRDHIEEIRIEGHTSSEWEGSDDPLQSYLGNMFLSQGRTLEVLSYVAGLAGVWDPWLKERLTANGLSSSRLVLNNGIEDRTASRRVEFRFRTDAEEQIARLRDMGR